MAWADFGSLLTVDVAYYQGDYWPDGNVHGVIVNVARGNQGSYQETTWGAKQVANARAASKGVGFYFFNGNLNAYTCGVLFGATLARLGFNPATDLVAIDCEDEGGTNTHAWGPAECADFINGVATAVPVTWNNVLVYMNYSVNRRFNWSQIVSYGARLWYARPGHSVDQIYWPFVTMKQDGLYNGVDADGHNQTYTQIIGSSTSPVKRKRTMTAIVTVPEWGGAVFILNPGSMKYVSDPAEVQRYCALEDIGLKVLNVSDGTFQQGLRAYILPIDASTAQALIGADVNYYVAPWLDARNAPTASVSLTAQDKQDIAGIVASDIKIPTQYQIDTIPGKAVAV